MGEQLYWASQLPLLFYVPDFFKHAHHKHFYTVPCVCALQQGQTDRSGYNHSVSFPERSTLEYLMKESALSTLIYLAYFSKFCEELGKKEVMKLQRNTSESHFSATTIV